MGREDDLPDFSSEVDPDQQTMLAEDLRLGMRFGHRPWLLVVGGRSVGTMIELHPNVKLTIGRAPPAEVVLDEEGVSRRHAHVELVAGGVVRVTDLDSSNGVRV